MKSSIVMIMAISASQLLFGGGALAAAQPDASRIAKPVAAASATASARKKSRPDIKPVDINSASKAELEKLPGLSAADAQRVIAARPYLSKAKLVTDKIISGSQYETIKTMIVARQKAVPQAGKAAGK